MVFINLLNKTFIFVGNNNKINNVDGSAIIGGRLNNNPGEKSINKIPICK